MAELCSLHAVPDKTTGALLQLQRLEVITIMYQITHGSCLVIRTVLIGDIEVAVEKSVSFAVSSCNENNVEGGCNAYTKISTNSLFRQIATRNDMLANVNLFCNPYS